MAISEEWHPGSFTKNFSWGPNSNGLRELHNVIRRGFKGEAQDVPRAVFRERLASTGRPDFIPLNFFLLNRIKHGTDFVVVDELVFQAINFKHSPHFDRLALFAFNLSRVGRWKGARPYQSRPALWAFHYIAERLAKQLLWDAKSISADDIEDFINKDPRYVGKTTRKLATNLNYLYRIGRISDYRSLKPERWWLSALFLALDRFIEERTSLGHEVQEDRLQEYLIRSGFYEISGPRSLHKDLTAHRYLDLYRACGGWLRFSEDAVRERQRIYLKDLAQLPNDPEPVGVLHPADPTARNAIPRACALLAHYLAGFEPFDIEDIDNFDVQSFAKERLAVALDRLRNEGLKSDMTAEDVLAITRGE